MSLFKMFSCLAMICLFSFCKTSDPEWMPLVSKDGKAKNIILLIGDGMGLSQISAALYANDNRLNMERFPVVGFHKSHSQNNLVTDSAAAATAFSCGIKTYNNAIGMTSDTLPCKTILEELEEKSYATGLVATSSIVHATPAAFISHQPFRIFYEQIAADFLNTEIDLFIGGGREYFTDRKIDSRNLYKELLKKNYHVSDFTLAKLSQIKADPKKNFAYFTADNHPASVLTGRNYLTYAAKFSAEFLKARSETGFFLMIEGSQIDWAGHSNDGRSMIKETLDFDKAIGAILDFARKDGNTLVIVTADHETGGAALNHGSAMGKIEVEFTGNAHTATMIPVFAYGPSAELFSGIYENTEIYYKMKAALGLSSEPPSSARVEGKR